LMSGCDVGCGAAGSSRRGDRESLRGFTSTWRRATTKTWLASGNGNNSSASVILDAQHGGNEQALGCSNGDFGWDLTAMAAKERKNKVNGIEQICS